MILFKATFATAGLLLTLCLAGCGMVHSHVDCDQVTQQQRSGSDDAEIAKATGFSVSDIQSCSEVGTSGGRETANNYQDQPHLPVVPTLGSGAIR